MQQYQSYTARTSWADLFWIGVVECAMRWPYSPCMVGIAWIDPGPWVYPGNTIVHGHSVLCYCTKVQTHCRTIMSPSDIRANCKGSHISLIIITFGLKGIIFGTRWGLASIRISSAGQMYLILKKYVTLPTISFYNMNAMGIGQMILYLGINIQFKVQVQVQNMFIVHLQWYK